jgi:hypothetical protein
MQPYYQYPQPVKREYPIFAAVATTLFAVALVGALLFGAYTAHVFGLGNGTYISYDKAEDLQLKGKTNQSVKLFLNGTQLNTITDTTAVWPYTNVAFEGSNGVIIQLSNSRLHFLDGYSTYYGKVTGQQGNSMVVTIDRIEN